MKKFIFSIAEGIQVIIEANNLSEAQKEYEAVKQEAAGVKTKIIKIPRMKTPKKGIYEYLLELKDEGFFSTPKSLGEIRSKLAELTINKPLTSFPPYLNSLIKQKILKRTKQVIGEGNKEVWGYENG